MTGVITSIPPLVEQPPGNNSSNPAGLPGITYVAAIPILPQIWSALQTFLTGTVEFTGSTSGNIFLNATAIASGTLVLPAVGFGNADTLVARNTVDTLTNKTLTSPIITGAAISGSSIAIHSTGTGNFDLSLLNSENLTAGRSLTLTVNDVSRTLNMGGNITTVGAVSTGGAVTTAGALTISGAFGTTLTVTGTTTVTLPTAGTLATLAGVEALTNKTINGNTFTTGTYTLTGAGGKTLTFNNTITIAGTDATTLTFQGTDTYVGRATTDTLTNKTYDTAGTGNSFKINGTAITAVTGTGSAVLATSPALVTPALGTPTSGTLTNCTGLPLSGLANQAAWTFLFNNTSGSAAPTANTIDGLTLKASPAGTDELILWDIAGSAIKKATVSSVAAGSTVSSIAGNTGAFTLTGGVTNNVNAIEATQIVNAQVGTSYAIVDGDRAKLITATNAAAQAYTIAQAGTGGNFASGWFADIQNNSTNVLGIVTITATTSTFQINGLSTSTLKIFPGQSCRIVSDGTNYQVFNHALTNQTLQANPSNPTGTTSAVGVMMGLGSTCTLTPTYSTRIKLEFIGNRHGSGTTSTSTIKVYFGTGAAPVNGAATTGTQVGNSLISDEMGTANLNFPFSNGGIITGLTPGTAYWFDLNLAESGGNTGVLNNLSCNAFEF